MELHGSAHEVSVTPSHRNWASIVGVIVIVGSSGMLTVKRLFRCVGAWAITICVRTAAFVVFAAADEHAGVVLPDLVVHPLLPSSEYWMVMNGSAASACDMAPPDALA